MPESVGQLLLLPSSNGFPYRVANLPTAYLPANPKLQALGMLNSFQHPTPPTANASRPNGQPTNSEPSSEPPVEQGTNAPAAVPGPVAEQEPEALADELMREQMQEQVHPPLVESPQPQVWRLRFIQ